MTDHLNEFKDNDSEKLALLIKVLKNYAEQEHYCEVRGDDYNPNSYTHGEAAYDDGFEYGQILFARTLLEQIGENFEYPCMKKDV